MKLAEKIGKLSGALIVLSIAAAISAIVIALAVAAVMWIL